MSNILNKIYGSKKIGFDDIFLPFLTVISSLFCIYSIYIDFAFASCIAGVYAGASLVKTIDLYKKN